MSSMPDPKQTQPPQQPDELEEVPQLQLRATFIALYNAMAALMGSEKRLETPPEPPPIYRKRQPAQITPSSPPDSPYDKGEYHELGSRVRDIWMEWGNGEYADFGQMFDQWSDLIDGVGRNASVFAQKYAEVMKSRLPSNTERYGGFLTTVGINPRNRRVELIRRGEVTIAVLIAQQGDDLYVSWRAYVQGLMSLWRIVAVILTVAGVWLLSSMLLNNYNANLPSWVDKIEGWVTFILPVAILVRLIIVEGMLRRRDWWGWFRDPVIPLQYDNVISLGLAVHRSILVAADLTGIESAKLQPRQPLYALRKPLI